VARKSDGSYTYFVPDVAYHVTKWQRGFRKVIDVRRFPAARVPRFPVGCLGGVNCEPTPV